MESVTDNQGSSTNGEDGDDIELVLIDETLHEQDILPLVPPTIPIHRLSFPDSGKSFMQQSFIQTVQYAIVVPRQVTGEKEDEQWERKQYEKERVIEYKEQIHLEVEDYQMKEIVIQQVRQ